MASFAAACRLSARLARQKLPHDAAVRGFRTSSAALAAQNFTMPALSPTMTEGNIATWQVKEGDKFSAGDVLLEIETDKATMDVEAQEDGIMMKIMQGDGSKGVQVGARIAVIAEEGDDISSLEIPADESPKPNESKESASRPEPSKPEEAQAESSKPAPETKESGSKTVRQAQKQTYPLLPSVAHLLHEKGIDEAKISEMTPTGPNGRLLKGDVLAYLGAIAEKTPADIEARWGKLSHLDLSNIKVAEKKPEAAKPADKTAEKAAPAIEELLVTLPISLASVVEVQRKVQDTLGVFMPLSTFIARATDVANDELPLAAGTKPSADELFNQVLGLDKVGPKGSRGYYLPQISALPPPPSFGRRALPQKPDIIDILAAPSKKSGPVSKATLVPSVSTTGPNVFSLKVTKAEEKRARVFLERVKLVLENEPGRLVL